MSYSSRMIGLSLVACLGLVGCDDNEAAPPDAAFIANDAAVTADAGYRGATIGGTIPLAPLPDDASIDAIVVLDKRCCNVNLSLPDPTADEETPLVRGDSPALNFSQGVGLTYSNGAWSASVCLPVNSVVTYEFAFTVPFPVDPFDAGGSSDSGSVVVLPPPDALLLGSPPDADVGSAPSKILATRHNPSQPTVQNGLGGFMNTFGPVSDCSTVGASTGSVP
jgi:hypothetical protein